MKIIHVYNHTNYEFYTNNMRLWKFYNAQKYSTLSIYNQFWFQTTLVADENIYRQLLIILLITWPSELRLLLTQYCTFYINLKGDFKQTKLCTDGSFSWVEFVDFRMTCIKNLKKIILQQELNKLTP